MDLSAANTTLWGFVLQLGIIASVMLVANILRRKIAFFRKSLIPTAVLAGFLMLLLRLTNLVYISSSLMEMITYHGIAIGFIAMSLQVPDKPAGKKKTDFTAAKSGALIVSTYLFQAVIGLAITVALAYTVMPGLFKASGIILPMGYGQGSGQANNVGTIYENLGFAGGQSFGLSIAAAGFLCACVVGVIYLNILKRKGKLPKNADAEMVSGSVTIDDFQSKNEVPVAESVDRFSIQFALVILIYMLTFLVSLGITSFFAAYIPSLAKTISPLVWGFNFIIGSLLAIGVRSSFGLFRKWKWMTRQYQNNYLLSRISGFAFDLMIIGGIAAIDIKVLQDLWLPFVLLSFFGGWFTLHFLQWTCKKIYKDYYYEGMLSMYGMLTGTISSGVILLREIDPKFKTPAATNLLTGSSFAIVFGAPMLILIALAPQSDLLLFLTIGICAVYMVVLLWFMFWLNKKGMEQEKLPPSADEPASPTSEEI